MTRKQLLFVLVLDLAMMAFAGHGAWSRYHFLRGEEMVLAAEQGSAKLSAPMTASVSTSPESPSGFLVTAEPIPPEGTVTQANSVPAPVSVPLAAEPTAEKVAPSPIRKTFSYDNVKVKSVQLVGDFNKWTPQNFSRDPKGRWTLSVPLSPGDYSYSFMVDGKTVRDPYQRRTDAKGRSLLTVK